MVELTTEPDMGWLRHVTGNLLWVAMPMLVFGLYFDVTELLYVVLTLVVVGVISAVAAFIRFE